MQRVVTEVRLTLIDLKLAIEGTIIMSESLRDALDNIYDARIPNAWLKVSWLFVIRKLRICFLSYQSVKWSLVIVLDTTNQ